MASQKEQRIIEITVSGVKAEHTLRDLRAAARRLRSELSQMPTHTKEFVDESKKLRKVDKAVGEINKKLKNQVSAWEQLKKHAKGVFIGTLGAEAIQGVIHGLRSAMQGVVQDSIELSDELTAIEKTTGLSAEVVAELNDEFQRMDTRKPIKELRELAFEAGRMGMKTKEAVLEFVKDANILTVALKEDLGEGALLQVAKASDNFGVGLRNMGSGFNAVSANSKASAGYLVDFMSRTAPLAEIAKVTAGEMMGLGAALDVAGLRQEMSGTAMNKLLIDFTKNTSEWAEVAGIASEELLEVANSKGINEAFLVFLSALKKSGTQSDIFLRKMEEAGIKGVRAGTVFLSLANNIDVVRENQMLASVEIAKGTSLLEEYEKVNTNTAGAAGKLANKVKAYWMDSGIPELVDKIIQGMNKHFDTLVRIGKAVLFLIPIWVTYKSVLILATLWSNLYNLSATRNILLTKLQAAGTAAHAVMLNLLKLNLRGATVAFGQLTLAMAANPIGLIAAGIVAAIGFFRIFNNTVDESTEGFDKNAEALKSLKRQYSASLAEATAYFQILQKSTKDSKERLALIDKINSTYDTTLENLSDEVAFVKQLAVAYDSVVESMKEQMKLDAAKEVIDPMLRKQIDLENEAKVIELRNKLMGEDIEQYKENAKSAGKSALEVYVLDQKRRAEIWAEVASIKTSISEVFDGANLALEALGLTKGEDKDKDKDKDKGKREKKVAELIDLTNKIKQVRIEAMQNEENREMAMHDLKLEMREQEIEKVRLGEIEKIKLSKKTDLEKAAATKKINDQSNELLNAEYQKYEREKFDLAKKWGKKRTDAQFEIREKEIFDWYLLERTAAAQRYLDGEISEQQYNDKLEGIDLEFLERKKALYEEWGLDTEDIDNQIFEKKVDLSEREIELAKERYAKLRELAEQWADDSIRALAAFFDFQEIGTNLAMGKERQRHESDLNALNAKLAQGLISEEQFKVDKAALDEKHSKKEAKIKRQQWENEKAQKLLMAIIDTAASIIKASPNVALMTMAGIVGAIQVGNIISTPAPEFAFGGVLSGPSHSGGGIDLVSSSGKTLGNAEGDEIILNKNVYQDPVGRSIASAINVAYGGVGFDTNLTQPPRFDLGGVTNAGVGQSGGESAGGSSELMQRLISTLDKGVYILYDKLEDYQKEKDYLNEFGKLG